jgi:hypothetical protein
VGGAVNLSFDSNVVEVENIVLKAPKDVAWSNGIESTGNVTGIGFASFAGVSGTFTLATVEFKGIGLGLSPITLTNANDPTFEWANDSFESVNVLGTTGTISVSAVPEPETWAMLLSGAGLVSFVAKRRRCQVS